MTITAAQCEAAAELLAEREERAFTLDRMKQAKRCRIAYEIQCDDDGGSYGHFVNAEPMPITASVRKLLQSGIEEEIAAIDAKLLALGVEPPPPILRQREEAPA